MDPTDQETLGDGTKREVAAAWICSLTMLLLACGGERGETRGAQAQESTEATGSALGLPDFWAARDDPGQVWRWKFFDRTMIEETPHDLVVLDDAVWIAAESGKILKMDPEYTLVTTLRNAPELQRLRALHLR